MQVSRNYSTFFPHTNLFLFVAQNVVVTLLTRSAHPAEGEHISHFAPFFEVDQNWDQRRGELKPGPAGPARAAGRRVFNTHLRWNQMPRDGTSGAKYIYVMRDGRDVRATEKKCFFSFMLAIYSVIFQTRLVSKVVTSFYHHLRNQVGSGGFEGSFEDFFNGFMGGSIPYGRWVDHVKSWCGPCDRDFKVAYPKS